MGAARQPLPPPRREHPRKSTPDATTPPLPVTDEVGAGVELLCVREGGKLRVRVVSDGFDMDGRTERDLSRVGGQPR
jgi:hypothetical protein